MQLASLHMSAIRETVSRWWSGLRAAEAFNRETSTFALSGRPEFAQQDIVSGLIAAQLECFQRRRNMMRSTRPNHTHRRLWLIIQKLLKSADRRWFAISNQTLHGHENHDTSTHFCISQRFKTLNLKCWLVYGSLSMDKKCQMVSVPHKLNKLSMSTAFDCKSMSWSIARLATTRAPRLEAI